MLLASALALSLPLHLEAHHGQAPAATRFVATSPGYALFLSDTSVAMELAPRVVLAMNLSTSRVEAVDQLPGRSNYYLGLIAGHGEPM